MTIAREGRPKVPAAGQALLTSSIHNASREDALTAYPFARPRLLLAALALIAFIALLAPRPASAEVADQHLFAVRSNASLAYDGPLGDAELGGLINEQPAATEDGQFVAVRGFDNAVYFQEWTEAGWSGWGYLGGITFTQPAVAEIGEDLYVFARGTDGSLYYRVRQAGQWLGGWHHGGGSLSEAPVAQVFNGGVHLFARSSQGQLLHGILVGGQFSGWTNLLGILASPPQVTADESMLYVTYTGSNAALWLRELGVDGIWGPERGIGGLLRGTPAPTIAAGVPTVFVRGWDDSIYYVQREAGGRWVGWYWLAGGTFGSPVADADGDFATVFVVGADSSGTVWRTAVPTVPWPGWVPLLTGVRAFTVR